MSIVTTTTQTIASQKHRTWRINCESPNGGTPVISVYREVISLDASGAQVGPNEQTVQALTLACTPAAIAALPTQFQSLSASLSAFGDWLEQNPSGVASTPTA